MSPKKISSFVLICDSKTWSSLKEGKTISNNGLSLCADQVFDFVQEMEGIKLTLQGVGVTQKSFFLSLDL